MNNGNWYAHGKLLITGEYVVLDGAEVLCCPLKLGQSLEVKNVRGSDLVWKSIDQNKKTWFTAKFNLLNFRAMESTDDSISDICTKILKYCAKHKLEFLDDWKGIGLTFQSEFDRSWGMGTSSTCISCIAQWTELDAFDMNEKVFGGSGYDIACANANSPLLYKNLPDEWHVTPTTWKPAFAQNLGFVYRGKKQNSREAIAEYLNIPMKERSKLVEQVNQWTQQILECNDLNSFCDLLTEHEHAVGALIQKVPVQKELFADFRGVVKSLGAWGGDLLLYASPEQADQCRKYFTTRGFTQLFSFEELIL